MESNSAGDMVTFIGNVVAIQADGMLKARVVKVFYRNLPAGGGAPAQGQEVKGQDPKGQAAGGKEPKREITRIEADGDVMIIQGAKVGTGDHGVYNAAERTLTLTGNARVRQDRDWITGTKVTYYLDQDRSVVESGPGKRVESVIFPSGEAQKGPTKGPATKGPAGSTKGQ